MKGQLIVTEERLDDVPHARFTSQHQPEDIRPTDQAHLRSQRQRFRNVRSRPDARVEEYIELIANSIDDAWKNTQRADATVDLSATVVADDNALDAEIDTSLCIFNCLDAFEDDRALPVLFEEFEVFPAVAQSWEDGGCCA